MDRGRFMARYEGCLNWHEYINHFPLCQGKTQNVVEKRESREVHHMGNGAWE